MTVPASLRVLLERSIDYAGLFPPATLELEPALTNQADYVRSSENWMLNAFVLPSGKFAAARPFLPKFDSTHRLSISVLGPKTENAAEFRKALSEVAAAISGFSEPNASFAQLEMFVPNDVNFDLLIEAGSLVSGLPAFWETPLNQAEKTIALLAEYNVSRESRPIFGYKMRTGGVTADAFPPADVIARVLVAAAAHHTPIKFTAGLHHPVRQYREEVQTKMHGFLNVLGAAILSGEHKWNADRTMEMLEDEEASSFRFNDEYFAWQNWKIDLQRLRARRTLVTTFGSCSFDEPRDDLRALGYF